MLQMFSLETAAWKNSQKLPPPKKQRNFTWTCFVLSCFYLYLSTKCSLWSLLKDYDDHSCPWGKECISAELFCSLLVNRWEGSTVTRSDYHRVFIHVHICARHRSRVHQEICSFTSLWLCVASLLELQWDDSWFLRVVDNLQPVPFPKGQIRCCSWLIIIQSHKCSDASWKRPRRNRNVHLGNNTDTEIKTFSTQKGIST